MKKENKLTISHNDLIQEVVGYGKFTEGNRVNLNTGITVSTKRKFEFIRFDFGISVLLGKDDDLIKAEELLNECCTEMCLREKAEINDEEYENNEMVIPYGNMSLYLNYGMTIPIRPYESERFDMSLKMYIPDDVDFEEALKGMKEHLGSRFIKKHKEIKEG